MNMAAALSTLLAILGQASLLASFMRWWSAAVHGALANLGPQVTSNRSVNPDARSSAVLCGGSGARAGYCER
jgi:hypothetical protein